MVMADKGDATRRGSNPLYNDRKMKLGTFCTNLSGGCAITTIDGVLQADWPSTLKLAELADAMAFEALVPVGRWQGFGGKTNFNGAGFEAFSWAAGIAASTRYSGIFATSHVPTVHPIMAAKQGQTIDHISRGRFALNIVTGWHKPEIEMFGAPLMDHDKRYDMAEEWLSIIKRLWSEDDDFDFSGRFYQIKRGHLQPKPLQNRIRFS
jgi:alkanesulfonate monooxygenase SsuD/methylene tetrahydromethanopterin reductase-like flavin-dependent oxidoreductase (luciferase family)